MGNAGGNGRAELFVLMGFVHDLLVALREYFLYNKMIKCVKYVRLYDKGVFV